MEATRRELLASVALAPAWAATRKPRLMHRGSQWAMNNQAIRLAISAGPPGMRVQSLSNASTGFEWVLPGSTGGTAIGIGDREWVGIDSPSFRFKRSSIRDLPSGAVQQIHEYRQMTTGAHVLLQHTGFPDVGVIEYRCRVENASGNVLRQLKRFDPVVLHLRGDAGPLRIHTIDRTNYTLHAADLEQAFEATGGMWNRPVHAGWVAIENTRAGEFLFVGIEWEREWVVSLERTGEHVLLRAGLRHSIHDVAPGEGIDSPRIFVGVAAGDLERAARETQDYCKRFLFPKPLPGFPWAIYHVYSTGPQNMEEIMLREIDKAVWLGADMFHHDASWYAGSSTAGTGDWGAGLGEYVEHPLKFPGGLARVSQEIHRRGLKFGLWVDPVVVDSRRVGRSIPVSWLARNEGQDNGLTIKGWEAPMRQLCVANPEVEEHLKKELTSMVERYGVDWIKWDNSALGAKPYCDRTDHGHQAGDGSYRNVLAIYEIWAYLHQRFPDLVLEQCGFGSRMDFGLARYQRANWLTDALAGGNNNLASLARTTVLNAAYVYPSSFNLSGVAVGPEIDVPTSAKVLDSIFRSRMMGLFRVATPRGQISSRFSQWRPDVQEAARRNLVNFRKYRHLLSQDLYRLSSPANSHGWTLAEFCKRDGSEAVLFCFRGDSPESSTTIQPKGLRAREYSLLSYNTGDVRQIGDKTPIRVELGEVETSEVLHLSA